MAFNPLANAMQGQGFFDQQQAIAAKKFEALDNKRQEAFFLDARKGRQLLESNDSAGFTNLLTNRRESIERLGGDTSDVDHIAQSFMSGDIDGTIGQLKQAEEMGIFGGFLPDPLDRELKRSKISTAKALTDSKADKTTNFAPEISPVQTDPETGQKFIIRTDKNTNESVRVDVEGAIGESQSGEEQRLIRRSLIEDAGKESKNAFVSLKGIKQSLGTIDEAIAALDKGANTGIMQKFLPSFTQATIELENAANRMGLDVVSATTFGALSEGELRLAMDTAMPSNLQPKDLRKWLVDRKKAKQKLGRELRKMAISLGKGKTTIAEYLEKNATFGAVQEEGGAGISNLSDDDLFK